MASNCLYSKERIKKEMRLMNRFSEVKIDSLLDQLETIIEKKDPQFIKQAYEILQKNRDNLNKHAAADALMLLSQSKMDLT